MAANVRVKSNITPKSLTESVGKSSLPFTNNMSTAKHHEFPVQQEIVLKAAPITDSL